MHQTYPVYCDIVCCLRCTIMYFTFLIWIVVFVKDTCTLTNWTRNPKVIWEEPRRQLSLRHKIPIGYNGCPHSPPNCPFSILLRQSPPPYTLIHRPTQLITSNVIQIQSDILPRYTFRTDSRQTDRPTDRWAIGDSQYQDPLTLYIHYSDAADNVLWTNLCSLFRTPFSLVLNSTTCAHYARQHML